MAVFQGRSDDLDGSISSDVKTRSFSLEGRNYEIDLTEEHFKDLQVALEPYLSVARPFGRKKVDPTSRTRYSRAKNEELRTWARANGWPGISDRGRIPKAAVEAYKEASQNA